MTIFKRLSTMVATIMLLSSAAAFAGHDTETDSNDVILAGHDVVAYFTEGKPVEGDAEYTAVYNDAVYRFSSEKNRDLFRENPAGYAPQYGGFCAYGVSFGKKFAIDGKAFKVVDGKLFVNKNREVYKAWVKDIDQNIKEANAKWLEIENTPVSEL